MTYTWNEFCTYRRLAARRAAAEKLFTLTAMNRAFAGGQGFKDLHDALQADIKTADDTA